MAEIQVMFPEKLTPLFTESWQFKVMHGGRGGGKSHTVAQALLLKSMEKRLRILCAREIQKSLTESSMQVLKDYIGRLGLDAYFEVLKSEIRCKTTGSAFSFTGLREHTADTIKSFEGANIVWVEEAHSVTDRSWEVLIPTIVRTSGSEIWATFNPDSEDDYVYRRFVAGTDPDAWVVKIGWQDNPWFNDAMDKERLKTKALNDDLYRHTWEGECRSVAGMLFKRNWFNRFDTHPTNLRIYMASDYAVTQDGGDYTEHGVFGLDDRGNIWVIDWWSGQADPETSINAWLVLVKKHKPRVSFDEKGVILRALDSAINKRMRETQVFVTREALASAGGKAERALGFAARASAGTVYIPKTEWGDRLLNQLAGFTGEDGKTDDMVDVCSLIGRALDHMANAAPDKKQKKPDIKPFTTEWFAWRDKQRAGDLPTDYYR